MSNLSEWIKDLIRLDVGSTIKLENLGCIHVPSKFVILLIKNHVLIQHVQQLKEKNNTHLIVKISFIFHYTLIYCKSGHLLVGKFILITRLA